MYNIDQIQIRCPSKLSFKSHLDLMDDIFRISKEHGVEMKKLEHDETQLTFTWEIQYQYASQQAQAIQASIALLSSHHVVPVEVVYQNPIQSVE